MSLISSRLGRGLLLGFFACVVGLPSSAFAAEAVSLALPYVSQVPDGNWVAPWNEACEEASVSMVAGYYQKKTSLPVAETKKAMEAMIDWENTTFQKNADTDAEQTLQLINHNAQFKATIQRNPTLAAIQDELRADRPVIILVNMYALYDTPAEGDSYHVAVLSGYDPDKKNLTVFDPAKETERIYSEDRVMNALHDYNAATHEADGPATVLFTAPNSSHPLQAFFQWLLSKLGWG